MQRLSQIRQGAAFAVTRTSTAVVGTTERAVTAVGERLEALSFRMSKAADAANNWADAGIVGRYFAFRERGTRLMIELRAGSVTFLMVAYILAVNPNILVTTGGTCRPDQMCSPQDFALEGKACMINSHDPGAVSCLSDLKKNLITATAASSLISTFIIGYLANLPLALAPGLGINAYVAYQVVGQFSQGELTYEQAMAAIFVEGWIFVLLSVTGVRGGIIKYMPKTIALATSVGIGLMLAFTGLRNLDIVTFDRSTLVTLGGCGAGDRTYVYEFDDPLSPIATTNESAVLVAQASVWGCSGGVMRSASMWLGIAGGMLTSILLYQGVKGALIIGIAFVTIISWIPGHAATYLGESSSIPGGEARLEVFKQVVAVPTLSMTGLAWDWSAFDKSQLWIALVTFLYIDLLDCTGTLLSMAHVLDSYLPGFLDDSGEFPGQMWAFLADGAGIIVGSMMGTTPLTVFIESAAGIEDGARTGLAAIVVSAFFFVSLFFAPIFASIPPYATGAALVLVGAILIGHVNRIEWDNIGEAIPGLLTIVLMPMTYSVAYGVVAGLASYIFIHAPFVIYDWIISRIRPDRAKATHAARAAREQRRRSRFYMRRKTLGEGPPDGGPPVGLGGSDADSYISSDSRLPPGRSMASRSHKALGGGGAGGLPHSYSQQSLQGQVSPMGGLPAGAGEAFGGVTVDRASPKPGAGPLGRHSFDSSPYSYSPRISRPGSEGEPEPGAAPGELDLRHLQALNLGGNAIRKVMPRGRQLRPRPPGAAAADAQASAPRVFSLFPEVEATTGGDAGPPLAGRLALGSSPEFRLFDDVPAASPPPRAADFKLFGEVELSHPARAPPPREFKLFGDVEMQELPDSPPRATGDAPALPPIPGGGPGPATSPVGVPPRAPHPGGGAVSRSGPSFKQFDLRSSESLERRTTADLSSFSPPSSQGTFFGRSAQASSGLGSHGEPSFRQLSGASFRAAAQPLRTRSAFDLSRWREQAAPSAARAGASRPARRGEGSGSGSGLAPSRSFSMEGSAAQAAGQAPEGLPPPRFSTVPSRHLRLEGGPLDPSARPGGAAASPFAGAEEGARRRAAEDVEGSVLEEMDLATSATSWEFHSPSPRGDAPASQPAPAPPAQLWADAPQRSSSAGAELAARDSGSLPQQVMRSGGAQRDLSRHLSPRPSPPPRPPGPPERGAGEPSFGYDLGGGGLGPSAAAPRPSAASFSVQAPGRRSDLLRDPDEGATWRRLQGGLRRPSETARALVGGPFGAAIERSSPSQAGGGTLPLAPPALGRPSRGASAGAAPLAGGPFAAGAAGSFAAAAAPMPVPGGPFASQAGPFDGSGSAPAAASSLPRQASSGRLPRQGSSAGEDTRWLAARYEDEEDMSGEEADGLRPLPHALASVPPAYLTGVGEFRMQPRASGWQVDEEFESDDEGGQLR